MKDVQLVVELNEKLDSFFHTGLIWILAAIILISYIVNSLCSMKSNSKTIKRIVSICIASSFLLMMYITITSINTHEELMKAENEYYASLTDVTEVKVLNILETAIVNAEFCPHIRLKDSEKCTYVEFVHNNDVIQAFIPLNKQIYASSNNPVTITYLNLSEEDREHLNERFNFRNTFIEDHIAVYESSWVLGVSAVK